MTNTKFNKLWDLLRTHETVYFTTPDGRYSLGHFQGYIDLTYEDDGNVVICHHDKEVFRRLLVN